MAAVNGWRTYGADFEPNAQADKYGLLFAFWAGSWRTQSDAYRRMRSNDPDTYVNTRQLWRHADAIVALYEQFIYSGDLSTDGGPLPDGTKGAIPLDLQTGTKAGDDQLRVAIAQLWDIWRYRQMMSFRPKLGAIFGDVLTELVDDLRVGAVFPRVYTPDVVVDLELNYVGDIKRYALEYQVPGVDRFIYGKPERVEGFTFRKEVDGKNFRYFKNGKPAAIPEWGIYSPVDPNPYGFAPAIWDRHEIVPGDRGMSALERTLSQAMEMNSILSHALDYQRKQFSAPIGVVGGNPASAGRVEPSVGPSSDWHAAEMARAASDSLSLFPMAANGAFVTVTADVGKTTDLLQLVMDSILAESPESRYGQQILDMTQLTAPGVERALGTIFGRVKRARGNYDAQTIKKLQMATAIMGFRLNRGDYPEDIVRNRAQRYNAFRPFDLESYGRGLLDFGISDREFLPESVDERVDRLVKIEGLQSTWALRRAGLSEEEISELTSEREARRLEMAEQLTGIQEEPAEDENEEAPDNGEAG